MMRYKVGSWVFNVFLIVWTAVIGLIFAPWALVSLHGAKVCGSFWAAGVFAALEALCGITYQVKGKENISSQPAIYASRHQSAWDTITLLKLLDCPVFVLKRELLWLPIYGWHLKQLRMIAIDRSKGAGAIKKIICQAKERIASGRDIVIFPEGTRRPPDRPGDYQPGIAALYNNLDVPIIPVALNSGYYWGRNALIKKAGMITIEFLPSMQKNLDKKEFIRVLKERIEDASAKL